MNTEARQRMIERAREGASESKKGRRIINIEPWKPSKEGSYILDVVPYKITRAGHPENNEMQVGELYHRRPYAYHNLSGVGAFFICPKHTFGTRCPVCEKLNRAYEDKDYTLVKEFKPKKRFLMNVVVNNSAENVLVIDGTNFPYNEKVPFVSFGSMIDREAKSADADIKDGSSVFSYVLLDGDYSIKARFAEKEYDGRKYFDCDRVDFVKKTQKLNESLLDKAVALDDIFVETPVDVIEGYLTGSTSANVEPPRQHKYEANNNIPDDFKKVPVPNEVSPPDTWE